MASPYAQTAEEVMSALGTRPSGLTYEEIENRLRESGPNVLPKTKKDSIFLLILKQLKSLVIYILLGAAAISFIFGHFIDAGVIITVIVINVIIGFFQTYRAEKAIRILKKLIVRKAKVV